MCSPSDSGDVKRRIEFRRRTKSGPVAASYDRGGDEQATESEREKRLHRPQFVGILKT